MNATATNNSAPLRNLLRELPLMLLFNTGIAVFLFLLVQKDFLESFIYAQSIGLGIFLSTHALMWLKGECRKSYGSSLIAIPLGTATGLLIAGWINGDSLSALVAQHPQLLVTSLLAALVFGAVISYYFLSRAEIAESRQALENEIRRRAEQERRHTETQLKMLQAQIEPHFLFNTLSNVLSLIDEDRDKARRMLTDLTHYLRAALKRTREASATLADEVALLEAYLDIQSIRMGDRLRYALDVPDSLRAHPLPPLLIQPLVENAIKHGIEPQPEGGRISISARRRHDELVIEVSDSGPGFSGASGQGIGLENIRARLRDLYAARGRLTLLENAPHGVKARLILPFSAERTPR